MQPQISYTAVLLDDRSRSMLSQHFKKETPDGWKWFCHHMTITMGALPEESREAMLGKQVTITAVTIGLDEMAMAVGVTGFYSKNKRPHITLAINIDGGGKPMMSNNIPDANWKDLPEPITLSGVVTEFPMPEKKSLTEGYDVNNLPFFDDIRQIGGKIYQVGGAVRDLYLGKDSKDLDILITGVPAVKLNTLLRKYGKVDMVGASFGVIKFTPPGGEEIDIAIPRTERKTGAGYQGFEVTSDHTLPIETDLERRDFTINSIAKDSDGNIIDPFNGVKDLDAKLIRVTNPAAFGDDPLRMLRAVQFASRFEFKIEPETFKMIQKNAPSIAEISKERILIEFDKIVEKGDPKIGAELLIASGLYKGIFGEKFRGDMTHFSYVTRMSEFVYWLIECFTDKPDQYFKNVMKGEEKITKEIAALAYLYHNLPGNDKTKQRWMYFNLNKITPAAFESEFVLSLLHEVADDFKYGKYPASLRHLRVDGNDLLEMGFKGKEIGAVLNKVIGEIFADHLKNERTAITQFLKEQQ